MEQLEYNTANNIKSDEKILNLDITHPTDRKDEFAIDFSLENLSFDDLSMELCVPYALQVTAE